MPTLISRFVVNGFLVEIESDAGMDFVDILLELQRNNESSSLLEDDTLKAIIVVGITPSYVFNSD